MNHDLPYRPNVCMLVVNQEAKLFLGERNGSIGVWQFPQGGVESDATLEENVYRELMEELGVARADLLIIRQLKATHRYDFRNPPAYAVDKWRGQQQTFWLVRFLGADSAIVLNKHEPEFSNFRWCTLTEVRKTAEKIRLAGYERALEEVAGEVLP